MIKFKKLNIEGFGSIVKPTNFRLDQPGLNLMLGRVGSGKTTIPSALSWVLYNKTLKDKATIETWEELRDDDYLGTKVEVVFTKDKDEYRIIRCKNYKGYLKFDGRKIKGGSNLFIIINNKYFELPRTKNESQEFIKKITGYSFELFKNTIVFGQKMKRIIEESGPNKKRVFEEGFNIGFIHKAKELVEEDRTKTQKLINGLDRDLENLIDKIKNLDRLISDALSTEKNWKKEQEKTLAKLYNRFNSKQEDLAELRKELENITVKKIDKDEKKITKLKKRLDSMDELRELQLENEEEINELTEQIKEVKIKLANLKGKKTYCPYCGSLLKDSAKDKLKAKYKEKIKTLKLGIERKRDELESLGDFNEKEYKKLNKEIKRLEAELSKKKENSILLKSLQAQIKRLEKEVFQIIREINEVKDNELDIKSDKYKKEKKTLVKKLKPLEQQRAELNKKYSLLEWLIKDPLSNNGLKMYIFNDLLDKVNIKLNEYSHILGFEIEFGIDMDSHNKNFYQVIQKDGIIINYPDLSGGQKQLVDTAVALAIYNVMSEMRPTNLVFLDEPFESLGVEEVEYVASLISEIAKEKSVFIITHNKAFRPINANIIKFSLDSNKYTSID